MSYSKPQKFLAYYNDGNLKRHQIVISLSSSTTLRGSERKVISLLILELYKQRKKLVMIFFLNLDVRRASQLGLGWLEIKKKNG